MGQLILIFGGLTLVTVAAVSRFGVLSGLAIGAAVYLLMPWNPRSS